MPIRWTRTAANDLDAIEDYLTKKNPVAAIEQILTILDQVEEFLPTYPEIGRDGRLGDTRELVIVNTKFIVMYRVEDEVIYILRVLHSSRQWPSDDEQGRHH